MRIFITGIAGELGSNIARLSLERGYEVFGIDLTRIAEAFRLEGISDRINYIWKNVIDLRRDDLPQGIDMVVDCAAQPDRPFGTSSPFATMENNLRVPLTLLELFKGKKPVMIYPASGVEMLGIPAESQPINEFTEPCPTNLYGWTKLCAEQLYHTYYREYGIPAIITRSGSVYGEGMRSDQIFARFIINCLKGRDLPVRGPDATRTPQYIKDARNFYSKLFDKIETTPELVNGKVLMSGGNAEERDYSNIEIAEIIKKLTNSRSKIVILGYEEGETIDGKPVKQLELPLLSKKLLGWRPEYTLVEGLKQTIDWFEHNLWRYL